MQHAYSTLTLKTTSESLREFTGTASTPSIDSQLDCVEPQGAVYSLPLPLLWEHDTRQPIGHVLAAEVSPAGITVRARLVKITDAGPLRDRLETAWQSIRAGLVRGLSIGFAPIETEPLRGGGKRFKKFRWLELSACVIPANTDCSIATVKAAFSAPQRRSGVVYLNPPRRPVVYLRGKP